MRIEYKDIYCIYIYICIHYSIIVLMPSSRCYSLEGVASSTETCRWRAFGLVLTPKGLVNCCYL